MEIPHDSLDMGEMVTVHQALSSAWILRAWFTPEPLGLANGKTLGKVILMVITNYRSLSMTIIND